MTDEEIYELLLKNNLITALDNPFRAIRIYKFGVIEGHRAFARREGLTVASELEKTMEGPTFDLGSDT